MTPHESIADCLKTPRIFTTTFIALLIGTVLSLSSACGETVEKKVRETVIPKFEFRGVTPAAAFQAFTAATGIKVFYVPTKGEATEISISLTNVPAVEALKYLTELANLKFTYAEDGVHVAPK
jgi:hypothetical protein